MEISKLSKNFANIKLQGKVDESEEIVNSYRIHNDFWDEKITHYRRLTDWQQKRPMPLLDRLPKINPAVDINLIEQETAAEKHLENCECFADDIIKVWNQISNLIIRRLKSDQGTQIPGLCTITIQEEKVVKPKTGSYNLRRTPVLIMSRQVVHVHKLLNVDEYTSNYKVESVPLNLTEISNKLQIPPRIIKEAVTEVLQAFARALLAGKNVEFPFENIGKLRVQNGTAKMTFYDEFCKKMGLDIPKPNLIPTQEIFLDFSATTIQTAMASTPENGHLGQGDSTLPGQMTPLQKHVPRKSFCSTFHLKDEIMRERSIMPATKSIHDSNEQDFNWMDRFEYEDPNCRDSEDENQSSFEALRPTDEDIIEMFRRKKERD